MEDVKQINRNQCNESKPRLNYAIFTNLFLNILNLRIMAELYTTHLVHNQKQINLLLTY